MTVGAPMQDALREIRHMTMAVEYYRQLYVDLVPREIELLDLLLVGHCKVS